MAFAYGVMVATKTPHVNTRLLDFVDFCCYHYPIMARPKKPMAEAKSYMLRIRMTESERKIIEEAANSRSLETSTWARSELITLAKRLIAKKSA
jgi:hypothetical protein